MRKRLFIIFIFLTLIAIPATIFLAVQRQELRKQAAPATTLSLSPSSLNKKVGETFSVEVLIDTAANQVISAEIYLTFDPTKLEAQTITNGALFPNILTSGVVESGTASITVGAPSSANPVKGTGTVAVVRFKALEATVTPASIRFATNTFVGALGEASTNVLIGTTPATVTITDTDGVSPTPLATPAATPSSQPATLQIFPVTTEASGAAQQPLIQGKTAPGATVTITIYSTPITAVVTADSDGNWSYIPSAPLESGPHNVVVSAKDPTTGTTQTATSSFVVASSGDAASQSAIPISGNFTTTLLLFTTGVFLIIVGMIMGVL